jgi:hypothetical protein
MIEFANFVDSGMVLVMAPVVNTKPIPGLVRGVEASGIWLETEMVEEIVHGLLQQNILAGEADVVYSVLRHRLGPAFRG